MNLLTTFAQYDPHGQAMGWLLVLAIMIILPLLIVLPLVIFLIITYWKLFKKAGRNGWEAIVPFYNMYVLTEISGQNGWLFLLTLIPGVGGAIWTIMVSIKLAPAFGKDPAYAIGLIFLPIIFYPILAFGNARYVRNIFEKSIQRQANRLAHIRKPTDKDLTEIKKEDLEGLL